MKKILLAALSFFIISSASAKKVKFAVDMTGQIVNTTGVHIWGDFQVAAGYATDWTPNITPLAQETADTNIYSIVVDIPAFAKYEYSFINGDQSYEVEFVQLESRVGYDFNSNRWLYVDSIADDTTFVGAIMFSANAPAGMTLVRFLVNMQNESSVSSNGVHVGGTWQGWDPTTVRLYSFVPNVYEIIQYVTNGTYNYKFYNGNTAPDGETVTGSCSVFGNREINVTGDVVLASVCFGECTDCPVGIDEIATANSIKVYPNPLQTYSVVELDNTTTSVVNLSDVTGRIVRTYNISSSNLRIEKDNLTAGVYFVSAINKNNRETAITKLVVE
jgi:alpha-amylase